MYFQLEYKWLVPEKERADYIALVNVQIMTWWQDEMIYGWQKRAVLDSICEMMDNVHFTVRNARYSGKRIERVVNEDNGTLTLLNLTGKNPVIEYYFTECSEKMNNRVDLFEIEF